MDWNTVFGNGGTGNTGGNGGTGNNGGNGGNGGTNWVALFAATTTEVGGKVEAEGGKTRDHVTTTTAAALNESVANQNKNKDEIIGAVRSRAKKEAWYIAIMILLVAVVVGLVFYRYGIMLPESVYDAAGNVTGTRPDWWTIVSRGALWSVVIVAFMLAIPVGNKRG